MNKFVASVGLLTIGAAAAHAQYAPGLTPLEMSKAWSVSADLRGFYDDNYLTLPKSLRQSSWGTEFSPSVAVNHSVQDTLFSASYLYDLRWYATHPVPNSSLDQSHQFNARLEHEFSDRYKLSLNESFIVAQEPTILDPSVISTPLRTSGNNIHNIGQIDFTAGLSKILDLHLGYANSLYVYSQKYESSSVVGFYPSRSASLDRMEQTATIDLRWKATPDTTGVFGYQYEHVDYTSPEYIIVPDPGVTPGFLANTRNDDQHFLFVGADESFMPDLSGSIRLGAEYIDYNKVNPHLEKVSPYADANLKWQYTPQSAAQIGVKVQRNTTDVVGFTNPTLDTETTALYGSVNHNITDRLTVSAMGQAQWSTFNGGDASNGSGISGKSEDFYVAGLNLAYHFNPWFMTEAGYNYSKLDSEVAGRSYTRNQVYFGVRGTY